MRITGGALRSRRLVAPPGNATRPTSDRVREALFAILAGHVALPGARVLDLFAGTGALSFEAISRGADHATLVERSREAVVAIRANGTALGVSDRTRVVVTTVEKALAGSGLMASGTHAFDVVFVDPPYADVTSGEVPRLLSSEGLAARVAPGGVVVVEHASRGAPPRIEGLVLADARRYGDTAIAFFTTGSSAP